MTVRLLVASAVLAGGVAVAVAQKPGDPQKSVETTEASSLAAPAEQKPAAQKPAAQKPTPTAETAVEKPTPASGTAVPADGETRINTDALVLKGFMDRINAYLEVHRKAAGQSAKIQESESATAIIAAQDGLAKRIQEVRSSAKPGDIFTPEIRTRFRQLMYPEMKGEDGRDAKAVLKDDAPVSVPLKVNTKYTADSLPTTPSNLLLNLPTLPKGLEYRIVNKHLILLDVDASLIVDYIPNAIV